MTVDNAVPSSPITYAQLKTAIDEELVAYHNRAPITLTSVSGTNDITASASPPLTAYATGQSFWLKPAANNTGNVNLSINGLASNDVLDQDGAEIAAGQLKSSNTYLVVRTATGFQITYGGDVGPEGPVAEIAVQQHYSTTTTDSDPGTGIFRLNNATLASVTAVYLDNANANGDSIANYLLSFDDGGSSTNRGNLLILGVTDTSHFLLCRVTGSVVDGSGYKKLTVSHLASAGTWANGESFQVLFLPAGPTGPSGTGLFTGSEATVTPAMGDKVALLDASDTFNPKYSLASNMVRSLAFATMASASTTDIGSSTSPNVNITGVTTITSFGTTAPSGTLWLVKFAAALTLTHSSNLVLPSSANITTEAGDQALAYHEGSGVWNIFFFSRASGKPLVDGIIGKHTVWIPASAMVGNTTNGPSNGLFETTTNKNMVATKDFDASTSESAQFEIAMPKGWNEGTVTFQPVWSHAATTTYFGVVWELSGVATSNDDALDVAFGTGQTSTDTGGTTDDCYIGPESSAITIGGSPAEGDRVNFKVSRLPANASDTMAVDARLHGIKLYLTYNAATDS